LVAQFLQRLLPEIQVDVDVLRVVDVVVHRIVDICCMSRYT
jgi:hypothetical protein